MNFTSVTILFGIVIGLVMGVWGLFTKPRSMSGRILFAILGVAVLLPISFFCLYGFAATFEPTSQPVVFWAFRVGYVVIGLACVASTITFIVRCFRQNTAVGG